MGKNHCACWFGYSQEFSQTFFIAETECIYGQWIQTKLCVVLLLLKGNYAKTILKTCWEILLYQI